MLPYLGQDQISVEVAEQFYTRYVKEVPFVNRGYMKGVSFSVKTGL